MRPLLPAILLAIAPVVAQALAFSHAGYLLGPDDVPIDGSHVFTFRVTDPLDATVWSSAPCTLVVRSGYYSASIGDQCPGTPALSSTHLPAGAPRLLEVTIDGVTLAPPTTLGSAPTAADSARLGGLDLAGLEAAFDARYAPISGAAGYVRIDPGSAQAGGVSLLGTVSAGAFVGSGAGLTDLDASQVSAGVLPVSFGGTGGTNLAAHAVLLGAGAGALSTVAGLGTAGQVLTSAGAGAPPAWANPTGGGGSSGFATDGSAGTTCTTAGAVRWTGSHFQGCNGTAWIQLDNPGAAGAPLVTQSFAYTGADQQFRVPSDVSSITVKLWGAGGGGGSPGGWNQGFEGGAGGYTTATVAVTPGEVLTVVVGQGGGAGFPNGSNPTYGGGGPYATGNVTDVRYAGSGGGRSALRRSGVELVTAGGGGGGGSRATSAPAGSNAGGAGGGNLAESGRQTAGTAATGASSTTFGIGGIGANTNGRNGQQFVGGRPGQETYGGSGGGGYFGGGAGAYNEPGTMGGGAGGSGYVGGAGVTGGNTLTGSGTTPPAQADPSYVSPVGIGGGVALSGNNGLVVVQYSSSASPPAGGNTKLAFASTRGDQALRIPADVTSIRVKLWGAGGGGGAAAGWVQGYPGGAGGFTSATVGVTPGETLTVVVGQGGAHGFPNGPTPNYGGGGGHAPGYMTDYRYSASGGGRSAIRRGATELVTAGGGGGGGSRNSSAAGPDSGGAGGGVSGQPGYQSGGSPATGGSAGGPGTGGSGASANGLPGLQFSGGTPGNETYGGGGGGGYYGGGGGAYNEPGTMGGGAGGAGWASGPNVTDGMLLGGYGTVPPSIFDADYVGGIAVGGPASGSGGNGLVVVEYSSSVGIPSTTAAVFSYANATDQFFTVPAGVTKLHVKAWGAGGGGGSAGGWTTGYAGGAGGFTAATIPVTPGDVLTVVVGQAGSNSFANTTNSTYGGGGGAAPGVTDFRYAGSGGGRSALRFNGADIVTAGGGGGGGSRHTSAVGGMNNGGAGGGATGESGYQTAGTRAGGGTSGLGGSGGVGASTNGTNGTQYQGGRPGTNSYGGGGGGGWMGGGGGAYSEPGTMGGGGGGSGYVVPTATWSALVTGWGAIPPAQGDPDYAGGVAVGASPGGVGGHGRVVIRY